MLIIALRASIWHIYPEPYSGLKDPKIQEVFQANAPELQKNTSLMQ